MRSEGKQRRGKGQVLVMKAKGHSVGVKEQERRKLGKVQDLVGGHLAGKDKIESLVICVDSGTAGIGVCESLLQQEVSQGTSSP